MFGEDSDKDRYLITYADLITLLLGLFIILYSVSNIDSGKYSKMISTVGDVFGNGNKVIKIESNILPSVNNQQDALKTKLIKLIDKYNYKNSIRLDENARGITIHILENILFTSGKANLNAGSKEVLNRLAVLLKELPNDIRIEGHTDNVPIHNSIFLSNWHLSVTRALNTAYYLINNGGLSADKISVVGFSKYRPIENNNSKAGRANNRRVDIVIIRRNKNENNILPIWRN
ncbi:MAG TPA: chemotaxis protein MotB [Ignavibacteria bacterium]|nr:chemotaxis protein MotB [Ignavibacteria bacterium]